MSIQIDGLAVTKTWHTKDNIHFNPGTIGEYQRYEGNPGSSMEEGVAFLSKTL